MSGTRQLSVARTLPRRGTYRCALIGDSIVQNTTTTTWSGGGIVGTPTAFTSSTTSWAAWLELLSYGAIRTPVWLDQTTYPAAWAVSGQRGFWGMNFGVSGDTSTGILSRLNGTVSPCILDMDFDIAFLEGGTNDITTPVLTDQQIADNMIASLDLLINRGVFVIFLPIRAHSVASWSVASNKRLRAHNVNQLTYNACLKRKGVLYMDWDRAWADSTTTDGEPFANYSPDGTHTDPQGGYAIAKYMWHGIVGTTQVWPGLKSIFPVQEQLYNVAEDAYDATFNPRGNLFPNGMMLGVGGSVATGVTGVAADSMRCERSAAGTITAVASKTTPADNSGMRQTLTFTTGGVALEVFFIPRLAANTIDVSTLAGKWIEASYDVEISTPHNQIAGLTLYLQDSGLGCIYRGHLAAAAGHYLPNEAFQGRIFTPPIYLGAAPTTITPRAYLSMVGGGGAGPVTNVGRFQIRVIDDPRLRYGWTGKTYGEP